MIYISFSLAFIIFLHTIFDNALVMLVGMQCMPQSIGDKLFPCNAPLCFYRNTNPKSKIGFKTSEINISCRNIYWSQFFNQILIYSPRIITLGPTAVVLAALESRAASTTIAGHIAIKPKFDWRIMIISVHFCRLLWVPPFSNQFLIFGFELLIYIYQRNVILNKLRWAFVKLMNFQMNCH